MTRHQYGNLEYVVQYPDDWQPGKRYPLVIYLHGAGGRGRDLRILEEHPFFLQGCPEKKGVIATAPQCFCNSWFDIFEQLQAFARYAAGWDAVDPWRVYLMGASMGGYASWQLAMSCPELFAALVPICGGGMYWNAERLKTIPVWAFHGEADPVVRWEESQKMVEAVKRMGGNAKLTVIPGGNHNAWTPAFQNPQLWQWLLDQKKRPDHPKPPK